MPPQVDQGSLTPVVPALSDELALVRPGASDQWITATVAQLEEALRTLLVPFTGAGSGLDLGGYNLTATDVDAARMRDLFGATAVDLVAGSRFLADSGGSGILDFSGPDIVFGAGVEMSSYSLSAYDIYAYSVESLTGFSANGTPGFTGTGAYTSFTIQGGIITAAS